MNTNDRKATDQSGVRPPELGFVSKAVVARFLGLTPRTVENLHTRGLPHFKFGPRRNRYDLAEVKAWAERECRVVRMG